VRDAAAGTGAGGAEEGAGIRPRERGEQRGEEFRLREQQGLSPPATSEYSSSEEEEEEESDGGQAPPERWEPAPPSPRAAEAAEEQAPRAARKRPLPGGLRKRRRVPQRCQRAPRRCRCAPRRRLEARRWW
jgi:hypothetical protein